MAARGTSSTVVIQQPDNSRVQGVYGGKTSLWEVMFSLCPNVQLHYRLKGKVRVYTVGDRVDANATWEAPVIYVLPNRYHSLELLTSTTIGKLGTRVLARVMFESTTVPFSDVVARFSVGQSNLLSAMSAAAASMSPVDIASPVLLSPSALPSLSLNLISARTFLLSHLISIVPSWGVATGLEKTQISQVQNTLIKIVTNFVTSTSLKALHLRLGTDCPNACDGNAALLGALHRFPYARQFFCILGMSFYVYNENVCEQCQLGQDSDKGPVDTTLDHSAYCVTVPFADLEGAQIVDSCRYIWSLSYTAEDVQDKVEQQAKHGVSGKGPGLASTVASSRELVAKSSWLMFQSPLLSVQFLKQVVSFLVQAVDSVDDTLKDINDPDLMVRISNNKSEEPHPPTLSTSTDLRQVKACLNRFCRDFSKTPEDRQARVRVLKALSRFVSRILTSGSSVVDIGKTSFMQSLGQIPDVLLAMGCTYTQEPCSNNDDTSFFFSEEAVVKGIQPCKWYPFRINTGTQTTRALDSIVNRYVSYYSFTDEEQETFCIIDRGTVVAKGFHTGVEFVEEDTAALAEKQRRKEQMLQKMLGGKLGGGGGSGSKWGSVTSSMNSTASPVVDSDSGLISSVFLAKQQDTGPQIDDGTRILSYDEVQAQQKAHHSRFLTSVIKVQQEGMFAEAEFFGSESYKEVFHWITTLMEPIVDDDGVPWFPAFDLRLPPTITMDYTMGAVKKAELLLPPAAVVDLEPVMQETSSGRVEGEQPRYVSIRDTPLGQRAHVHLQSNNCWIRGYPSYGFYIDSQSNGNAATTYYSALPEYNAPVGSIFIHGIQTAPHADHFKLNTKLEKVLSSVQVREPKLRWK